MMNSKIQRPRISFTDEQRNTILENESAVLENDDQNTDALPDEERSSRNYQRRRRSSLGQRWDSLKQMGGPNSLDNFARSFQRAASSRDIVPDRRRSIFVETLSSSDEDDDDGDGDDYDYGGVLPHASQISVASRQTPRSLLSEQILETAHERTSSRTLPPEQFTETSGLLQPASGPFLSSSAPVSRQRTRERTSVTGYGSISPLLTADARRRASILADEQHQAKIWARQYSKESDSKPRQRRIEVESNEAGELITRIVGGSTVPMTEFNLTNSLVGIGMLALPLGLSHTGWVVGLLLFTAMAGATFYTALLLTRCLDTNTGSMTYSDISYLAFGSFGRRCVECLFFLELIVAGTGLIVLFGDSMNQLIPGVSATVWQFTIAIGLMPLNFAPFKYLSLSSVLGIFCTFGLILMVLTDGIIKPSQPGSLRQMAPTDILPHNIKALPLAVGIYMSPWGGHPVIPAVYRDMRHPEKFPKAARVSYVSAYLLDISMAAIGYLMFGATVKDEVTAGILQSKAYPAIITLLIILFIAVINTTKLPLATRPLIDTLASKFETQHDIAGEKTRRAKVGRIAAAIGVNLVELALAIAVPSFDSIVSILGSAFCLTICIILPVSFYLRIFAAEARGISTTERVFCWILIVVAFVLAVVGTAYAIIPRQRLGI